MTGKDTQKDTFDKHSKRYDDWFEKHQTIYESELKAVREAVPSEGKGCEIGVGSGRFSGPLSIEVGLDPSKEMLLTAKKRGAEVVKGVGEELPFRDEAFDFVLIVTTICFFDGPLQALKESKRVLKPEGRIIVGFIDKASPVGKMYQEKKDENVFYKDAHFFTVDEVTDLLEGVGFSSFSYFQTIFDGIDKVEVEEPKKGYNEGSFVVVKAEK
ncbi:MAG: class I SAM-dependent methyltransferase [Thermoplasmata archaeon]